MQKTIHTLSKQGFGGFESFECTERVYERRRVKEHSIYPEKEKEVGEKADYGQFYFCQSNDDGKWHTGYLTFCTKF